MTVARRDGIQIRRAPAPAPSDANVPEVGWLLEALGSEGPVSRNAVNGTITPQQYELGDRGRISRVSPDKPSFQVTWERNGLMTIMSKDQWRRACRKVRGAPTFQVGDMMEALPGRQYISTSGEDFFKPGDRCRIMSQHASQLQVLWLRTNRSSYVSRESWPIYVKLLAQGPGKSPGHANLHGEANSTNQEGLRLNKTTSDTLKDDLVWIERIKKFFSRNTWAKKETTRTLQKQCEGPVQLGALMEAIATSDEFQPGRVGRLSSQWQDGFAVTWEDTGKSSLFNYESWRSFLKLVGERLHLGKGDQVQALPDKTSAANGVEYYKPGDVGSVSEFYNTVDNMEIVRVTWNRTQKTSSHPGNRWPNYFKVLQSAATESTEAVKAGTWQVGSLLMARPNVEDVAPDGSIWFKPGSTGRVSYVSDDWEFVAVTWESTGLASLIPMDSWRCSFYFVGMPPELRVGDLMQALPGIPAAQGQGSSEKVLGRIVRVLSNERGEELFSIKWGDAEKTTLIKKTTWPTSVVLITDSDTRGRFKSSPPLSEGSDTPKPGNTEIHTEIHTEVSEQVPPFPVLPTNQTLPQPLEQAVPQPLEQAVPQPLEQVVPQPLAQPTEEIVPPLQQPAQEILPPAVQTAEGMAPPASQAAEGMAPPAVQTAEGMAPQAVQAAEGMAPPALQPTQPEVPSPPSEQPPVETPPGTAEGGDVVMPRKENAMDAADSANIDAMGANASQIQIGALMKAFKAGGSGAWVTPEEDLGDWYRPGDMGRVSAINGYMFSVTWQSTGRTSGHRLDEYLTVMEFKGAPPPLQVGDEVVSISRKPTVVNNISICSPGDRGHIAGFKLASTGEVMDVTWDASSKNTTVPLSSWPTYIWLAATATA